MTRYKLSTFIVGSLVLLLSAGLVFAGIPAKEKSAGVQKTTTNDVYRPFLINNVFNYYGNNGDGSYNKFSGDNEGFEFPKGSGKHVIFEDGVVWGGFHKGFNQPKVGGSVYRHGIQAGKILTPGTLTTDPVADDPSLPQYHVYRVRPDIRPTTDATEQAAMIAKLDVDEVPYISRYESYSATDLYNQYVDDWNNWPAADGAPYTDVDSNGVYDPTVDIPGQPGADQTLWYVANDVNTTRTLYLSGSPLIGIEMRRTVWGYNKQGALGNTIFASSLIINQSGAPIDSMFLVQWSDPDLGDAGDDFAGCDTTRSLGYIYNSEPDAVYGVAVPAGGFTFFQGPIVPGAPTDSAVFRLKYRHGYRNLKMSAFVLFSQGVPGLGDPRQGTGGNLDWYNLMNGLIASSGAPFIDPNTGLATKFVCAGDPVTGTGWIDGPPFAPAQDRRICLVTGPFNMAAGDTQELVVANVAGLGADRLSSITVMRAMSDGAQAAYNNLFNLPKSPPPPAVTLSQLDGEIVLTWGDPTKAAQTESYADQTFVFEGYNVYACPTRGFDKKTAKLIATYDKIDGIKNIIDTVYDVATNTTSEVVEQFGSDNGLKRSIDLKTASIAGGPLINGTTYYYALTSYAYSPTPPATSPSHFYEGPATAIAAIPQWAKPGVRYQGHYGDTIAVSHSKGVSDGAVLARIVDPQALTGASYKVFFSTLNGSPVWGIVRTLGGRVDTVARNETDQTGGDEGAVIVDGVQFQVTGAPNDFKRFLTVADKNGPINPPQMGAFAFNSSGFPTLDGGIPNGTNDRPDGTKQQSAGLSASQGWGIHTGMNDPAMDYHYPYFVTRVTQGGARWPKIVPNDFEIRFTATGGKALIPADFTGNVDKVIDVPFEIWNIGSGTPDNPSDDVRLFPYILDVDNNLGFNLLTKAGTDSVDNGGGGATHSISGGANDPFTDWIYWVEPLNKTPGQAGYNEVLDSTQAAIARGDDPYLGGGTDGDVMRRMVLVGWNFGAVATGTYAENMPETGTVFRIISTKPNTPNDEFTVVAPSVTSSLELAQADIEKVNVYPNPYFGFNSLEPDKYTRFVTFTHLPPKATIRIFNIAGVLLRTIMKNDQTQFSKWDLKNESGFPAASGVYVAYIDMPDLGKTKILKFAIIQEQQYIDRW